MRKSLWVVLMSGMLAFATVIPAVASSEGNPFLGSWENEDPFDGSHQTVLFSNSGNADYYDDSASVCGGPTLNWKAQGEYTDIGRGYFTFKGMGDTSCLIDGERIPLGFLRSGFLYSPEDDTLVFWADETCWYRTGSDPSVCED